jgi:carbamate kinase
VRIVAALGGNALLQRGERADAAVQQQHVLDGVRALAPLARNHELIITHGNGPQVGLLAAESAADPLLSRPYPFDTLTAQTQGMIGYWLLQALANAVPARPVVAMLTRTVVFADDPAFASPTKFVGPTYRQPEAEALASRFGWIFGADGDGWRRVVASPEPVGIPEIEAVRQVSASGAVVVCAGGGGIPVRSTADGGLCGVEAVVDKDLTASLLARLLRADALLLLTDVDGVYAGFRTERPRLLSRLSISEALSQQLPAGSMRPKVDAVCRYMAANPLGIAAIGRLTDAARLLDGRAGTHIVADHVAAV